MFELTLLLCVADVCSVEPTPIDYPSFERCVMAASITTGRVRSKFRHGTPILQYFQCTEAGDEPRWVAIVDGEIVARAPDPRLETRLRDLGAL